MDWETFLTYLGVCVAIFSPAIANKLFPAPAKAKKPISVYVPHHIDKHGIIVMTKKIDRYV